MMKSKKDRKAPELDPSGLPSSHACRNMSYIGGPERFPVPEDKISWSVAWPEYAPVDYTSPKVHPANPAWADPQDYSKLNFNSAKDGKVNRRSHTGEIQVVNGLPMNPVGRTGITSRGVLGKWGCNHAADPVVTRWKKDDQGEIVKHAESGKPILQFVSIKRLDTGEWAIPGGMVDAGDTVSRTLKKEFGEEALNTNVMSAKEVKQTEAQVAKLFKKGDVLYKGYADDPRNTDNAWMETIAVNYHDKTGDFDHFKLCAGDDAGMVKWCDIDQNLELYGGHKFYISGAAKVNGAHW